MASTADAQHRAVKTKVMISGEREKVIQKAVRWPCGGRGVGSNSVQCTRCQKWVHKMCTHFCIPYPIEYFLLV